MNFEALRFCIEKFVFKGSMGQDALSNDAHNYSRVFFQGLWLVLMLRATLVLRAYLMSAWF